MRLNLTRHTPWILALAVCALDPTSFGLPGPVDASAQTFVTPKGEAQNVRFEQREGGIVHIFYDLVSSDPRAVFSVMLEASQDKGTTFGMRPPSVTGDAGDGVTPGTGKRIVWDSGKDVERVQIDQFRFRIVATAGPLKVETPPAPTTPSIPTPETTAPVTGAQPPVSQPQQAAKKGGSGKWLLIGGGAAAAAAAAVLAGGGGGPPPPPPNRPPTIGSVSSDAGGTLLATATRLRFSVTASDADNDVMVASWDFGDGTSATGSFSAGTATTEKVFNNAGTFTPSVTVSDRVANSGFSSYPAVTVGTVTGSWTARFIDDSFLFSPMNLNQNGSAVNGDTFYGGVAYRISGSVSSPRAARLLFTHPDGRAFTMDINGSADLRTFSGTGTTARGAVEWSMTRQ